MHPLRRMIPMLLSSFWLEGQCVCKSVLRHIPPKTLTHIRVGKSIQLSCLRMFAPPNQKMKTNLTPNVHTLCDIELSASSIFTVSHLASLTQFYLNAHIYGRVQFRPFVFFVSFHPFDVMCMCVCESSILIRENRN